MSESTLETSVAEEPSGADAQRRRAWHKVGQRLLGLVTLILFLWPTWFVEVHHVDLDGTWHGLSLPSMMPSGLELLQCRVGVGQFGGPVPWTLPTRAYLSSFPSERHDALATVEALWWALALSLIPMGAVAAILAPGTRFQRCSTVLGCGGATAVLFRGVLPWGIFTYGEFVEQTLPGDTLDLGFVSAPLALAVLAAFAIASRRSWRDWPVLALAVTCALTSLTLPLLNPKRTVELLPVGQIMRPAILVLGLSIAIAALLETRWLRRRFGLGLDEEVTSAERADREQGPDLVTREPRDTTTSHEQRTSSFRSRMVPMFLVLAIAAVGFGMGRAFRAHRIAEKQGEQFESKLVETKRELEDLAARLRTTSISRSDGSQSDGTGQDAFHWGWYITKGFRILRYNEDGWETPIFYRCPGPVHKNGWDLISCGPNGIYEEGQGDDIVVGEDLPGGLPPVKGAGQ